jgi:spore coat protein JC
MAAEQKARSTYEFIINLADNPDVIDSLKFLRKREIVHFQRFGEALRIVEEYLNSTKFYPAKMPGKRSFYAGLFFQPIINLFNPIPMSH